jgi:hypothetical protein
MLQNLLCPKAGNMQIGAISRNVEEYFSWAHVGIIELSDLHVDNFGCRETISSTGFIMSFFPLLGSHFFGRARAYCPKNCIPESSYQSRRTFIDQIFCPGCLLAFHTAMKNKMNMD